MKKNSVRIIGGKWRGQKIDFPDGESLRPTHDRIRETLFNWLMHDIVGANCLDLFAGSGSLGFEALSRGASEVTFVDTNFDVCNQLQLTANKLKTDKLTILTGNYLSLTTHNKFDIVFLDPPFKFVNYTELLNWLSSGGVLANNSLVYLEMSKAKEELKLPINWECSRHKSTSTVDYYLFKHDCV